MCKILRLGASKSGRRTKATAPGTKKRMTLLAIDVGTTHCKAALFSQDGKLLHVASRPMMVERAASGDYTCYEPERLWRMLCEAIGEITARADQPRLAAIGITSMAETGMLLDWRRGVPRSPFLPWFDTAATPLAELIEQQMPTAERFGIFGIYPSFKCSLAKILWWRKYTSQALTGVVWLSVADYIAYRLTGTLATDYSLAGRTYAFDLRRREWANAWLEQLGLPGELFPAVRPAGTASEVSSSGFEQIGLAAGVPVVIAGHDHICAALAAGIAPGAQVFDSMGTAEVLIGAIAPRELGAAELESGLSFGYLPGSGAMYWLGGLSSSGGALEWLRAIFGDPPLAYSDLRRLQERMSLQPGTIIFLPYLAGSSAPRPNPARRGAFIGLDAAHDRADLLKAVLEGTAYQIEAIRQTAVNVAGAPIEQLVAAGGGTRNRRWLQIKADIHGVQIDIPAIDEASLLGAALIGGIGAGIYANEAEARGVVAGQSYSTLAPDAERHLAYIRAFAEFWRWQARLQ
jgi:sugar (pentulose or hexulose) kinase